MSYYSKPQSKLWRGRKSEGQLYLHEKVRFLDLDQMDRPPGDWKLGLLGYACDEGVGRNHGRIGAAEGPDAIRRQLAKLPNHLRPDTHLYDVGNVGGADTAMESAQEQLAEKVVQLLRGRIFPILLGGGHDMAYGHYQGLKGFFGSDTSIGIINFDAHFDLRNNTSANTSGTPFYQIARDSQREGTPFHYLCLGIRRDANDAQLFQTAGQLNASFIENIHFTMNEAQHIVHVLLDFIRKVDRVYVTIDLDGFSSAYAPGVSAPSPMGFSPKIVIESLELILKSQKLVAIDIAEMNPRYDRDHQTAKLAASLVHYVMHFF